MTASPDPRQPKAGFARNPIEGGTSSPPLSEDDLILRISVTDRCQFRCSYCSPDQAPSTCATEDRLSLRDIVRLIGAMQRVHRIGKVRLTGGDPLLRPDLVELVAAIRTLGIPDIAMTTNGQRLAEKAGALAQAGLTRVTVSLDSLQPDTFHRLSGGGQLNQTLAGIDAALAANLRPVKLNMVVLRGANDAEVNGIARFALTRGCLVRFLEVMPIGAARDDFARWFVPWTETQAALTRDFQLAPLPVGKGETSRNYTAHGDDGTHGTIGFIAPCSEPFCEGCRRLRITSDGWLIGCLARGQRLPLKPLLNALDTPDQAEVSRLIEAALSGKRRDRTFSCPDSMSGIGG